IEQAIKLCLRFTLGALERDVTGQAFPAQRITTEVKLQFPTALALRADMSLALVSHFFVSCFCFSSIRCATFSVSISRKSFPKPSSDKCGSTATFTCCGTISFHSPFLAHISNWKTISALRE